MVELDRKNDVIARHRPVRPERRSLAIMHGIVAPQLRKQRPPAVVLIEMRIADVDRRKAALQRLWLGHVSLPLPPSPLRAIGVSGATIGLESALSKAG